VRALKKPTGLSFPGFEFGVHPSQSVSQDRQAGGSLVCWPGRPGVGLGWVGWVGSGDRQLGGVLYWQRF
jgi:hypothetical protein